MEEEVCKMFATVCALCEMKNGKLDDVYYVVHMYVYQVSIMVICVQNGSKGK